MQYLFYISIIIAIFRTEVSGAYHENSVLAIKAPNGLKVDGLFGYSIAYQQILKRLIVSAPHGNSVGQVFECHPSSTACKEIVMNQIKKDSAGFTDMWLGATVATGTNFTVMCAPRFTEDVNPTIMLSKRGTFGRCYVSSALGGDVTQMKVLDISKREPGLNPYEKYMDSFGWATYVDQFDSILVGGPAMHTGRAIFYSDLTSYPQLIANSGVYMVNYNFGYSITSGKFKSIAEGDILYAISSPYGKHGEGLVILTDGKKNLPLRKPRDYYPPVGSLYGASLCSAKLRGLKQREALLVGAPLYFQKDMVDVGAVYVYQFHPEFNDIVHQITILGTVNHGRFGSAILNLGDLNGDKRDEIAISAPYEESGGAVYIYSSVNILADEPAHKVRYLQKIQSKGFSTFGFSMSALQAYNDNGCNELAIGAPESNVVLLYKCMPQITVHVRKLEVHTNPGYPPKSSNNTHFEFDLCVDIEYPAKPNFINVELEVKLSLTHATARITNSNKDGSINYKISTITKKNKYCNVVKIEMPKEGSYEPVIQYQATASQLLSPMSMKKFDPNLALLSDRSTLVLTDAVWVADCAHENKCEPVLTFEIETTMRDHYMIGTSDSEQVWVVVKNAGDPAYTACARVNVQGVRVRRWPAACSRERAASGVCAHNQPLRNNTTWNSGAIELETKSLKSNNKVLNITVDLYEQCSSKVFTKKNKEIKLTTDPKELFIKGMANLGDDIPLSTVEIDETGKQFSHIYTVINVGVTTWVNVTTVIGLQKKPYYDGLHVTIDSQADNKCNDDIKETEDMYGTHCVVSEVKSNQKFDVIISIYIKPKTIDKETLEKQNLTQTSYILIYYGDKTLQHNITSTLRKKESVVPLWVIISAALVGLLIMLLIAFALYECGFLRRKNKEKLKELKRSVHRQSMRRSMMDRDSKRIISQSVEQQSDEKQLIEESDDSAPSTPAYSSDRPTGVPVTTPTTNIPAETTQQEGLPPNPTDNIKTRKELIILGLQKNIGRQYKVNPPKPTAEATNDRNDKELKE